MDRPGDGRSGVEICTSPKLALSLSSSVGQDKLTFQCLGLLIHKLVINNRKTSMVTGVLDVLTFDLNEILLETEQELSQPLVSLPRNSP